MENRGPFPASLIHWLLSSQILIGASALHRKLVKNADAHALPLSANCFLELGGSQESAFNPGPPHSQVFLAYGRGVAVLLA